MDVVHQIIHHTTQDVYCMLLRQLHYNLWVELLNTALHSTARTGKKDWASFVI